MLAMCFDNIAFSLVGSSPGVERPPMQYNSLSFLHLLTTVSIATDLSKQIKKKYDHSRFYD